MISLFISLSCGRIDFGCHRGADYLYDRVLDDYACCSYTFSRSFARASLLLKVTTLRLHGEVSVALKVVHEVQIINSTLCLSLRMMRKQPNTTFFRLAISFAIKYLSLSVTSKYRH